jgi:hypothetical protein
MHGALFTVEATGELLEDAVRPDEYLPVASGIVPVTGTVEDVPVQGLLIVKVEGPGVYGNLHAEGRESLHELR